MSWMQIESLAYWCVFVASFFAVAIWESRRPKYDLITPAGRRWGNHGILLVIGAICNAAVLRMSPVAVSMLFAGRQAGLSNPSIPLVLRFAGTILLMDFVKYATHRLFHTLPWLWRVHQVHHSDPDFDVSTAARAHPIETIGTQGAILVAIALTSPPVLAVIAGELLGAFQSLFEHANVRLPKRIEPLVRKVLITSDMHRVHHSEVVSDQMTNYGEIFPWWDRLLGTYRAESAAGSGLFKVGMRGLQNPASLGIRFMLAEPFLEPEANSGAPGGTSN